ncbi:hypothetical protein [Methylorubrum zatmanii]|uniref:Uncharacterized protein n=1 Tax=Methylorubrum zatmanii TaxID=29429 RepID=A0ABW1WLR9_9HYPH|nr:hypothetical protein [Methylorubrum zatmanii]
MPIPMPQVDGRERHRCLVAHALANGLIVAAILLLLIGGQALAFA